MSDQEANSVKEVVKEFTEADNAIKTVFSKVDPVLVVTLIFDEKAKKREYLYLRNYPQTRTGYATNKRE